MKYCKFFIHTRAKIENNTNDHHGSWFAKLRVHEERQIHTESTPSQHWNNIITYTKFNVDVLLYTNPDVTVSNAYVPGITLEAQTRDRSETTNKIKRFSPVYS